MAKLSSPRLWNMLEDGPRSDARNDMLVGQLVRTWVLDRQQQRQAASNFHPSLRLPFSATGPARLWSPTKRAPRTQPTPSVITGGSFRVRSAAVRD